MTLIDKFEAMPFQDVGTFNSIFKTTPIIGFCFSTQVEIKGPVIGGRKILVGDSELVLNIPNHEKEIKSRTRRVSKKKRVLRTEKPVVKTLPSVFKELTPSQFMLYSALKLVGNTSNISALAAMMSLTRRTIAPSLKVLEAKGLVKTECINGGVKKISVDKNIETV